MADGVRAVVADDSHSAECLPIHSLTPLLSSLRRRVTARRQYRPLSNIDLMS